MFGKGYASLSEKISDELALKESRLALEQGASPKKRADRAHPKQTTTTALKAKLEAAKAERAHSSRPSSNASDRSRSRSATQIARCKVTAPIVGRVHYAAPMGPGAVVRDGQLLFRIVPDGAAGTEK